LKSEFALPEVLVTAIRRVMNCRDY
jgi:hypothetical protein